MVSKTSFSCEDFLVTDGTECGEPTPEMIAAGVAVFRAFDTTFETEADGVRKIYLAMIRASPKRAKNGA